MPGVPSALLTGLLIVRHSLFNYVLETCSTQQLCVKCFHCRAFILQQKCSVALLQTRSVWHAIVSIKSPSNELIIMETIIKLVLLYWHVQMRCVNFGVIDSKQHSCVSHNPSKFKYMHVQNESCVSSLRI